MKKKIIISAVVLVALVLIFFLPIPQGTYRDGGTRAYSALTYKIVVWNKIMAGVDENGETVHTYRSTSVFWYPDNQKSIDELWQIETGKIKIDAPQQQTNTPSKNTQSKTGDFTPDYDTTNTLHCDEFLKKLKSDGYIRDSEKDCNYNTDNITRIVNITPKSISDETSDIEVFCVNDAHCFLMVNHTIYRYDTFGGYHHQLCLWDYDNNGTKDLVSYNTSGSGLSYMSVDIFDLTSFEGIQVITRMTLNEPAFSFECKNGVIYIDGEELTYSNGSFHCNSFNKDTP